jgi:cytochrome b561
LIALAAQIVISFGPVDGPGMATMNWLPLHMSIGVTILAIVVLRLCLRIFTKGPVRQTSRSVRYASAFVHLSLYVMILAVLITGWLGYRPMPFMPPARLFGNLPVPLAPSVGALSARGFAARALWTGTLNTLSAERLIKRLIRITGCVKPAGTISVSGCEGWSRISRQVDGNCKALSFRRDCALKHASAGLDFA